MSVTVIQGACTSLCIVLAKWQVSVRIVASYPEVCEAVSALNILHPEPDLSVRISLILQQVTSCEALV